MEWFEWMARPEGWISLLTLTFLEVVLGIDNIIFISIQASHLPPDQQPKARKVGLLAALVTRILLLMGLAWMVKLTKPLFELSFFGFLSEPHGISGRDLILLIGGLFLIWKSTHEIHKKLEGDEHGDDNKKGTVTFSSVIIQIMMLDIVFSLDSVITAVGMVKEVPIMVCAVIIAMIVMLIFNNAISDFIHKHPTLKMLALSFLLLVGVALLADALHFHIPRGYLYFAIFFSALVEALNLVAQKRRRRAEAAASGE